MSEQHTPETDGEAYMVECTSVQNYGIEDPSEVVDATFSRKLERQRDELLTLLKHAVAIIKDEYPESQWVGYGVQRMDAAIAKVEGGGV